MSNHKNIVKVEIQGDTVSIINPKRTKKKYRNEKYFLENPVTLEKRLGKRRNKMAPSILKIIYSLEKSPDYFATLMIYKELRKYLNAAEIIELYSKFRQKFTYKFKKSWIIYKYKQKSIAGIHCHMLIGLPPKYRGISEKEFNDVIYEIFSKILKEACKSISLSWRIGNNMPFYASKGIFHPEITDAFRYEPACGSYLLKKSKKEQDMKCMESLSAMKMWGIVGKKNMNFRKTFTLKFSEEEAYIFRKIIASYLKSKNRSKNSIKQLLDNEKSLRLSNIPHDILIKAYELAKKRS